MSTTDEKDCTLREKVSLAGIVREQLDEAAFAAAWAEGQAMTLEQAIAYALEVSAVDVEQPAPAVATAKQSG
jgi:hypothetical protein